MVRSGIKPVDLISPQVRIQSTPLSGIEHPADGPAVALVNFTLEEVSTLVLRGLVTDKYNRLA